MQVTDSDSKPLAISPVNWRITWLILVFVSLSLTASALPLLPSIRDFIPLEAFSRTHALAVYGCFLAGFMVLLFPLFVRKPESGSSILAWWCVGGFMLAFAGVPLYVLAYIAGVQLESVLAVLVWAGIFQGVVLLLLRLMKYRGRVLIVAAGYLLAIVLPVAGTFRELLAAGEPGDTPFDIILGITRRFDEPDLVGPTALLVLVHALVLFGPRLTARWQRRRSTLTALLCVGAGSLILGAGSPPAPDSGVVSSATGGWFVPGHPVPLRLAADASGNEIEVRIGVRQRYRWRPVPGGPGVAWIYPAILNAEERIEVFVGGRKDPSPPRLELLPPTERLVLVVTADGNSPLEAESGRADTELVPRPAAELPADAIGYRAFDLVVASAKTFAALDAKVAAAIDSHVRAGGRLCLTGADRVERRVEGGGVREWTEGRRLPARIESRSGSPSPLDENLYSNFALPDWGRVDLSGLLIFLVVYHAVFYLIFLLPLFLDAKKTMLVYLSSVGFVLTLVVGGAYFGLKEIFLKDTQILQQNVGVYLLEDGARPGDGPRWLRAEQICCFASFNAQPGRLRFDSSDAPALAFSSARQPVGEIRLADDAKTLELSGVPLDRFRRKQVVRLSRMIASPFRAIREGDTVRLSPTADSVDPLGIYTSRRRAAFVRRDGRLYPVAIEGDTLRISAEPAPRSWQSVVPESIRNENGIPFIRHVMGRYADPQRPLLIVLLEGVASLHRDTDYLDDRDICQLLLIPLESP